MPNPSTYNEWIPSTFIVGVVGVRSPEEDNPLGYALPKVPSEKKNEKRKDKVRSWAKKYRRFACDVFEFENKPRSGFKIAGTQRRNSRESNNGVFRVIDPVGYTFEVSIENMYEAISQTTLKEGEFQNEFVLSRKGQNNTLVPVGSEKHENLKISTNAKTGDFSMSDVSLGNEIQIQKGIRGVYVGRWDVVEWKVGKKRVSTNTNRKYGFLTDDGDVILHGSPSPGYIFGDNEISYQEAGKMIHSRSGKLRNSSGRSHKFIGVTRDRGESVEHNSRKLKWEDGTGNLVEGSIKDRGYSKYFEVDSVETS